MKLNKFQSIKVTSNAELNRKLVEIMSNYSNPIEMDITYPEVHDADGEFIRNDSLLVINGDSYLIEVTE